MTSTTVPRPRRLLRRILWALAVVVLVPVAYVASAVSLSFADGAGWLPDSFWEIVLPVYEPLGWYIYSGYPGADAVDWACRMAGEAGGRITRD